MMVFWGLNNCITGEAYKYEICNTFGNIFCKTENSKPSRYWYWYRQIEKYLYLVSQNTEIMDIYQMMKITVRFFILNTGKMKITYS